jgi:hypothetical protein
MASSFMLPRSPTSPFPLPRPKSYLALQAKAMLAYTHQWHLPWLCFLFAQAYLVECTTTLAQLAFGPCGPIQPSGSHPLPQFGTEAATARRLCGTALPSPPPHVRSRAPWSLPPTKINHGQYLSSSFMLRSKSSSKEADI